MVVQLGGEKIQEEATKIENGILEKEYYFSSELKVSYTVKDGKLNGSFSHLRENILLIEGSYLNNKLHGAYKKYYPNRQVEIAVIFEEGVTQPGMKTYHENGNICIDETFDKTKEIRIAKEYDEDGKLVFITEYVLNENNLVDGKITRYNDNGTIWWKANYKNSKKFGKYLSYHKNGKLLKEEYYNEEGEKHGPSKSYYKSGALWSETIYKKDIIQEKETSYFENGAIKVVTPYNEEGKPHGIEYSYYENGTISDETNYLNGTQNGTETHYHENGKVSYTGTFKDNSSTGKHIVYRKDGTKKLILEYNDEGEEIDMQVFNETGLLSSSYTTVDDKTTIYKEYFSNGQVKELNTTVYEKKHGETFMYYDDGTLRHKLIYKRDKLIENVACYDRNGNEIDKGNFVNGNGTVKFYNNKGKLQKELIYKNNRVLDVKYYDED